MSLSVPEAEWQVLFRGVFNCLTEDAAGIKQERLARKTKQVGNDAGVQTDRVLPPICKVCQEEASAKQVQKETKTVVRTKQKSVMSQTEVESTEAESQTENIVLDRFCQTESENESDLDVCKLVDADKILNETMNTKDEMIKTLTTRKIDGLMVLNDENESLKNSANALLEKVIVLSNSLKTFKETVNMQDEQIVKYKNLVEFLKNDRIKISQELEEKNELLEAKDEKVEETIRCYETIKDRLVYLESNLNKDHKSVACDTNDLANQSDSPEYLKMLLNDQNDLIGSLQKRLTNAYERLNDKDEEIKKINSQLYLANDNIKNINVQIITQKETIKQQKKLLDYMQEQHKSKENLC